MYKSFENIIKEHGDAVYRYALACTKDTHLSEDIFQDTFLLLLEKKPKFTHKNQLRVWLIRTARYIIIKHRRKAESTRTQPLDTVTVQHTDTSTLELYELMDMLSDTLKEAALLYYIEDMSVKDISKALEISVSAVKVRLKRAREALKNILEEDKV